VYEPSFASDREEYGDEPDEGYTYWPTRRWYSVTCAEDILWPPMSAAAVAANERRLGWLPQDLKDMAMVANGLWGGNDMSGTFMYGGWHGLDSMEKETAYDQSLIYFTDIEHCGSADGTVLYSFIPPQENAGTEIAFVLFPPDTWAVIWQEVLEMTRWADNYAFEDGDYAIGVYKMHLAESDIIEAGKDCFRKWVTRETKWVEESWVAGEKIENWGWDE
jgi:hypothetical protein